MKIAGYRKEAVLSLRLYADDILSSNLLAKEKNFMQHGCVSVYSHSVSVSIMALILCRIFSIKVDERSLVRGALLHDYFLYDWHKKDPGHKWHGFTHSRRALKNAARDFHLNKTEQDIILTHMFPLNLTLIPRKKESALVCLADKLCALHETFFCRKIR